VFNDCVHRLLARAANENDDKVDQRGSSGIVEASIADRQYPGLKCQSLRHHLHSVSALVSQTLLRCLYYFVQDVYSELRNSMGASVFEFLAESIDLREQKQPKR
jgi:hypothetical protein